MSTWGTSRGADSGILRNKTRPVQGLSKPEELLVFGYACKIFRDNEKAIHIDQGKHLIPWMGDEKLRIDRYDGRGTLSNLTQYEASKEGYDTTRWLGLNESERKLEELCDAERYYSLEINEEEEEMYKEEEAKRRLTNAFQYNYNENGSTPSTPESEPEGIPTVPEFNEDEQPYVPSPLLDVPVDISIPQTIKEYARIEKTSLFVCKQGQQMEILIKAKQSDNPQFSFLTQTDPLYKFYRHLLAAFKNGRYQPQYVDKTGGQEKREEAPADDSGENHYLHPSLVSTKKPDQSQVPTASGSSTVVPLPYQPSANCAYSQLVTRIQGTTAGSNGQTDQLAPPTVVEAPPPATAQPQLTAEQHQYYQFYYLQQYYSYYRQMVQTGQNGAQYANLPPDFHQLDPAMQNFVHQLAFVQYTQHCHQQQQAQEHSIQAAAAVAVVQQVQQGPSSSYAQIVSNVNKDGINPYAAGVPQLPEEVLARVTEKTKEKNDKRDTKEDAEVTVKKPLLSLAAAYGSDSETEEGEESGKENDGNTSEKSASESEESVDLDGKQVIKPEIKIPPSDVQVIIDKMADYVFKNGEQFEGIIKAKNDPRFDFLKTDHEFYEYYKKKLRELKGEPEPEPQKTKKTVKKAKPKKVIAPVSFSIKKAKEEPAKEIKSALPLEESSDEDVDKSTEKNQEKHHAGPTDSDKDLNIQQNKFAGTIYNIQDQSGPQKLTHLLESALVAGSSEVEHKNSKGGTDILSDASDGVDNKEKRAGDKLKDKLAAVAREKLASVTREKALQLERKRKAAAFLKLKAQGDATVNAHSATMDSSSLSSMLLSNVKKNKKTADSKKVAIDDDPIFDDLPPKPKKKSEKTEKVEKPQVQTGEDKSEKSTEEVQERLQNRLDVSTSTTEQTKSSESESSSGDCEIVGVSFPKKQKRRSRSKSGSREKKKHREKKRKRSRSPNDEDRSKRKKEKKKKSHKKKHAKSSHDAKHKKKSKRRHKSRSKSSDGSVSS